MPCGSRQIAADFVAPSGCRKDQKRNSDGCSASMPPMNGLIMPPGPMSKGLVRL